MFKKKEKPPKPKKEKKRKKREKSAPGRSNNLCLNSKKFQTNYKCTVNNLGYKFTER